MAVPTVDIPHSDGVTYRISAKVRVALEGIVRLGLKPDDAAVKAGITPHALYCARRKPHVKKVEEQMFAARRSASVTRAWHEVETIAFGGEEEKNRLAASSRLLEYGIGKPGADADAGSGPAQYVVIGQLNVTVGAEAQATDGAGLIDVIEGSVKLVE
jgi:hypothetical protein